MQGIRLLGIEDSTVKNRAVCTVVVANGKAIEAVVPQDIGMKAGNSFRKRNSTYVYNWAIARYPVLTTKVNFIARTITFDGKNSTRILVN